MITRVLAKKIKTYLREFPIVAITGPRQSGKTTLLQNLFPQWQYLSLEDPDTRLFAEKDPRGFLATHPPPLILDEVQKVPELFSYLQTEVDRIGKEGQYILSGSQNMLMSAKISQSLAGRVGMLTLFPLSIFEISQAKITIKDLDQIIFNGGYPRVWDKKLNPVDWYSSYVQTYLERDVRQLKNITDLSSFQRFLKLCAGRTGQMLNLSSLANDSGINHNTARSWISILEASYLVYLLPPYYTNINKRLVKSPKMYFYDTGLACNLLGLSQPDQLTNYHLKGPLFETLIMSEIVKTKHNRGEKGGLYFLNDKVGHEVDCLIEQTEGWLSIEIKSGRTITNDYFSNLIYWQDLKIINQDRGYVVYGGNEDQQRSLGQVVGWQNINKIRI